jgi:DNA-binding NtrC family response regulator
MSFARRILLVGADLRFSQTIQTHLHKSFLLTVPAVRADELPDFVSRETDGVLLFLAAEPGDVERIESAVRDLRLRQLPPRLAVLEADTFTAARRLDRAAAHLDARFSWPAQLRELNAWIRRAVTTGTPFADPNTETVAARISRQLLAQTPSLAPLVEQLEIAATHDVAVLIDGESGTGKTHLARLIHDCSARSAQRFLAVNCAAATGHSIASEFFGHVPGAFLGADAAQVGKFAVVGAGTILLDEIDSLALEHQASVLRVIETGEFEPIGGSETQTCAARFLASTTHSLGEAVERGTFRRDLYYRLHVVTFHLPPLRTRPQDIAPLTRGLLAQYAARFNKRFYDIHPDALRALERFPWPGNIRQLENVLQQAALAATSESLTLADLPPLFQARAEDRPFTASPNSLAQTRETTERAMILRALEKVSQSRTRAAELLGVSRVTLYKKMKKYGLLSQSVDQPTDIYNLSALAPRVGS